MENKNINLREKYFYPMTVSNVFGREDTKDEILERWDNFDTLSEAEKDTIISATTASAIEYISKSFSFSQMEAEEVARIVRSIFFKELTFANIGNELMRRINNLSVDSARRIAGILNEKIFLQVQNKKNEQKNAFIMLSIKQALEQFKQIGEQHITEGEIVTRFFSESIKPSVNNWIMDFHDVLGGGKHSPIERGNYLFHSENGKKLNAGDRQKLGLILKSLDEETPLTVDVKAEKVIFDGKAQQPAIISSQPTINNQQSFSNKQRADGDVFERYAPKNLQAQNPVNERVSSLEKFYTKYPASNGTAANQSFGYKPQQTKTFSPNFAANPQPKVQAPAANQPTQAPKSNFGSPNFVSGNISFSSAQKLPVEQSNNKTESQLETSFPQPVVQSPFASSNLYHIGPGKMAPSETTEKENNSLQNVNGQRNIVNLREINNGNSIN